MSLKNSTLLALDVGEKRIGVARAMTAVPIAVPIETIEVDGSELQRIEHLIKIESVDQVVIGYPRNQSGEATAQTEFVEKFAKRLDGIASIVFQDESLTSVHAEQRLKAAGKPYQKGDIDAHAAAIILQDYLEINHAS